MNKEKIIQKAKEVTEEIEILLEARDLPKSKRKELLNTIDKLFHKSGLIGLERAYAEKLFTKQEYDTIWSKKGLTLMEMQPVLMAYFNKKDGLLDKDEEVWIVTTEGSPLDRNREFIKERLGLKIVNVIEALERLQEKPDYIG